MDKSCLLWIFVIVACTVGSSDGARRGRVWKDVLSARGNDPGVLDTGDGDGELGLIGSFVKTRKRYDAPLPPSNPLPECEPHEMCADGLWIHDLDPYVTHPHRCKCSAQQSQVCGPNWQTNSNAVLTFTSAKRRDWQVQYLFCTAIFENKPVCVGLETAMTLQLSTAGNIKCRCNNFRFELNKMTSDFIYHFSCAKGDCPTQTTCAKKTYLWQNGNWKFYQTEYLCNCPNGEECKTLTPAETEVNGPLKVHSFHCSTISRK